MTSYLLTLPVISFLPTCLMCFSPITIPNPVYASTIVTSRFSTKRGYCYEPVQVRKYNPDLHDYDFVDDYRRMDRVRYVGSSVIGKFQEFPFTPTTKYIEVPCGKCPDCKRKRQDDYTIRLFAEVHPYLGKDQVSFVTFTYAPKYEHLLRLENGNLSLVTKHIQNLFKSFRHSIESFNNPLYVPRSKKDGRQLQISKRVPLPLYRNDNWLDDNPVSYLYPSGVLLSRYIPFVPNQFKVLWCSEYGSMSNRPHFHAIIIGLPRFIVQQLLHTYTPDRNGMLWKYGRCIVEKPRNAESVSMYLAKYSTKQDKGTLCFSDDDLFDALGTQSKVDLYKSLVTVPDGVAPQKCYRSLHLGENDYLLSCVRLNRRTTPKCIDSPVLQDFDSRFISSHGFIPEPVVDLGSYVDDSGSLCPRLYPLPRSLRKFVYSSLIPDDKALYEFNFKLYNYEKSKFFESLQVDFLSSNPLEVSSLEGMSDGLLQLSRVLYETQYNRKRKAIQSVYKSLSKDKSASF